ncbi:OmpA family protein [Nocardiopsis sp. FR6]|uniref:OmpA family protein n=1 Tax=Nocardiopsis sp. FR6 TaxID=2605986 RepID=UPI001356FAED|nr:OmpA family protein [Nocardiopsis sp. FR6]
MQYLRGGTIPDEAVIAAIVVFLWGLWAAHLVVFALDVVALLRGLVPRVGLVRLVWVLAAGGATAASTHTAAVAAQTDTAPAVLTPPDSNRVSQGEHLPEKPVDEYESRVIERTRNLSGFGFDSDELTPEMKESLEPTVGIISDFGLPDAPVVVTGHTDPVGSPAYNQHLSEQRAQAVADYLAERLEGFQFEAQGMGSTQAPDNPQASYGEHRRVEISYKLQQPTTPPPVTKSEEQQTPEADSVPEQAQLDVNTASEQDQSPSALLIGAVAGTAGAGVGYAVGRRRSPIRRRNSAPEVPPPECETDTDLASEAAEGSAGVGELFYEDLHGLARGAIDEDGFVLISDTSRVSGRHGLGFAGAHAVPVLGAVVADHSPRPTVATRASVAALGGAEAFPSGVQVVTDVPGARIAVEAEVLTTERCRMDDGNSTQREEPSSAAYPQVLVVCSASDLGAETDSLQTLTSIPRTVVTVLGNHSALRAVVQCDDLDRIRLTSSHGEVNLPRPLRHQALTETNSPTPQSSPTRRETTPEPEITPEPAVEGKGEEGTSEATHRVRVRLFAPEPVITYDGQPVTGLRSVARTLLAFLALHPDGADAEQIADVCFANADPDKATAHRRNAIHSLRATLRKLLNTPGDQIVRSDHGVYRIDESIFDVDLWEFLRLASKIRKGEGSEAGAFFERLFEIHQESLLGGRDDAWVLPARERCTQEAVNTYVRLAESTDSDSEKIDLLEKAISFDEYNEPLYQRIMMAYRDSGSPEGAHRAYRALKERLENLGESPSPESQRVAQECTPASL